jgi:hypothetical protein
VREKKQREVGQLQFYFFEESKKNAKKLGYKR